MPSSKNNIDYDEIEVTYHADNKNIDLLLVDINFELNHLGIHELDEKDEEDD
jgi:hypothetical protein